MNHALTYREPNRVQAGLLALAVHAVFIVLLMFGMHWQAHPPEVFSVDLWDSLPVVEPAPAQMPLPPTEPAPAPVVAPAPVIRAEPPPVKADIEVREKKASKAEPARPTAQQIKAQQEQQEQRQLAEYAEQRRQDVQARIRADIDAATATEVERYKDMISSKIQRNIKGDWSSLPATTVAEYRITMLPDGAVMDAPTLLKSSGNPAYDDAVGRAIYSAQPLPLPTNEGLKKMFRTIRLTIRPKRD